MRLEFVFESALTDYETEVIACWLSQHLAIPPKKLVIKDVIKYF